MKKIIENVANFPNGCETVKFTACLASMLMKTGCNGVDKDAKHTEIYNLYNLVSGYSFLQIDLSNDEQMKSEWEFACQKLLREFDYYVGYTMDFAGLTFDEVQPPDTKDDIFDKIKGSIDRDIPVLIQFVNGYQWVAVTGYDDNQTIYGFDGSQGYWGKSAAEPIGYEDGLFVLPDWYEKMAHAFIVTGEKETMYTTNDLFARGIKIMERMQEKGYYKNSVAFMRNDDNFTNLTDEQLLEMRGRISRFIGHPIDQKSVIAWAVEPMPEKGTADEKAIVLKTIHDLCNNTHDTLWIAWNAIGEFMDGDPLDWAKGLRNKVIRNVIADCFDILCRHEEQVLINLKKIVLI